MVMISIPKVKTTRSIERDNMTLNETGDPAIEFTYVPPYGSFESLRGQVWNADPADYRVAVYIKVEGGWWNKPFWSNPLSFIFPDGTWNCRITTGGNDNLATEITAFLVPLGYSPPLMYGGPTLPSELDTNAVARVTTTRQPTSDTIYIRTDGSVEPLTAPIQRNGDLYTLIDNITSYSDGIVIERGNMTLDGAGYTIEGTGSGKAGIKMTGRDNVTIKNMEIKAFKWGIWTIGSKNNTMIGNNIANNEMGIFLHEYSNYNSIDGNNISGIWHGIILWYSNHNSICRNNITADIWAAITIDHYSSYNSISWNNIASSPDGIYLSDCNYNSICYNNVRGEYSAIAISVADYNNIYENNITNSKWGIRLYDSSNNSIIGNNITNNACGIFLQSAQNNTIYHNNFVGNKQRVDASWSGSNFWDNGYPSGGNYWSDYNGVDFYGGPYQNETGSDGIGDTPYVIDGSNKDNYPIIPEFSTFLILPLFMITTLLAAALYRKKHSITHLQE